MLIRIAPDMFVDPKFECITLPEVRDEIFRTTKFKNKYPWRIDYKGKIKPQHFTSEERKEVEQFQKTVSHLVWTGEVINDRTKRPFDLSGVDSKLIAYACKFNYTVSTNDQGIIDFLEQQFELKNSISTLGLLNKWISANLIKWNDTYQNILFDWDKNNEAIQTQEDKQQFERITGFKYVGA